MGNALTSIIVVDGQSVGTWKRTLSNAPVVVEISAFRRLTKPESRAVTEAPQRYGKFLELPVVLSKAGVPAD